MTDKKINGLILSGGKSLRMGQDKGLINYHGKPQREHLFSLLSKWCHEVFISCKSSQEVPAKLNPLVDVLEMDSPLNGILTAFNHNPSVAWISVPVDMPMIDEAVLKYLIDHRDEKKLATCFYDSEGKNPEPLLAIWEPAAAAALESFHQAGNFSPRKFLLQHNIHILPPPSEKIYLNINTREELFRFRAEHP